MASSSCPGPQNHASESQLTVGSVTFGAAYVPVMERNHNPTAQDEMARLLDECAKLGRENAALRGERTVLAELLEHAVAVLRTLDPEDASDGELLQGLIARAEKACAAGFAAGTKPYNAKAQAHAEADRP